MNIRIMQMKIENGLFLSRQEDSSPGLFLLLKIMMHKVSENGDSDDDNS